MMGITELKDVLKKDEHKGYEEKVNRMTEEEKNELKFFAPKFLEMKDLDPDVVADIISKHSLISPVTQIPFLSICSKNRPLLLLELYTRQINFDRKSGIKQLGTLLKQNEHQELCSINKEELTSLQKKNLKQFIPRYLTADDWNKDRIDETTEKVRDKSDILCLIKDMIQRIEISTYV